MAGPLPDFDVMYQALAQRDTRFEGLFVVGVKTTGIFCRPGCPARTPKRENVTFFQTAKEALAAGFRPCRMCRPMEPAGACPDWLHPVLDRLETEPDVRLTDQDLCEMGVSPARVRRWFRKQHGMTFHAYQRALRISRAFGAIRHGEPVISAAYASGYESLSAFGEGFRKIAGFSPTASRESDLIPMTRVATPLGPMLAAAIRSSVCLLEFCDRPMLETQLDRLQRRFRSRLVPGTDPVFDQLQRELDEYFRKERRSFSVPLAMDGTPFQLAAWQALQAIPYGETRSYGDQARAIGRPDAVRAVARANGDNRIAILIPCHRVIGSDGSLTGYGGGLERKRYLLSLEGAC